MNLLFTFVGTTVVAGSLLLWGLRWTLMGGRYWSYTSNRYASNLGAGLACLFFSVIACTTAYLMARDLEPTLIPIAAAMLLPLLALWWLLRASCFDSPDTIVDPVVAALEKGHAAHDLEVVGRSAVHAMVRATLALERPGPAEHGYREAPSHDHAYAEALHAVAARARRRLIWAASSLSLLAAAPIVVAGHYAWTDAALEPLGWRVIFGCSGMSLLYLLGSRRILGQMRRIEVRLSAALSEMRVP